MKLADKYRAVMRQVARPITMASGWFSGRWRLWLDRRVPPQRSVRLHQRNVFIFPPASGIAFLTLVVLLVLMGINYQNSLVFALAFLLFSLFTIAIAHTFRNLSGMALQAHGASPVFAGDPAMVTLHITGGARRHHAVQVSYPGEQPQHFDLDDKPETRLRVPVPTLRRGWLDVGRLLIESSWPLGLLRTWAWIDLDQRVLVYPAPLPGGVTGANGCVSRWRW